MKGLIVITLSLVAIAKSRPDVSHLGPSRSYLPLGNVSDPYPSIQLEDQNHAKSRPDVSHMGPSRGYLPLEDVPGPYPSVQSEDHNHVYFYASSDGDFYSKLKINLVPSSQKNTRIIFIRAPSHQGVIPEVIAPPSLSEDKTLVYVLVKNAQDGTVTIPVGLGTKPAKPEVYFIKYDNRNDAEPQIKSGVQEQQVGSSVPEVGGESAFVGALDSGSRGDISDFAKDGVTKVHPTDMEETSILVDPDSLYGPPDESGPYL